MPTPYRSCWATDEHELFRDTVRDFVARELLPHEERFIAQGHIDPEVWTRAGAAGLLGCDIPAEHGGLGGDFGHECVVYEEVWRTGFSGFGKAVHEIAAHYVLDYATPEQQARWLPQMVAGELVGAIAMSEPGAGSDLRGIATSAVRDGDDYVVNGSKTFITNGYSADLIVVAARTAPEKKARGISLFGIEASMDGFSRGRKLDKAGQDESDTAELFFEDVRVPADNLIGELDSGFIHMMNWLPQERLGSAITNISHAAQILEETLDYIKERKAFGQAVGSFQHNKFLAAELVTKVEMVQTYVDQAVLQHVDGKLTPIDAAKVKWISADVQNDVLDNCVQLYGGYGYMNEYRVTRAWRDARVTKIWAGSNEIMKELIGRDLGL